MFLNVLVIRFLIHLTHLLTVLYVTIDIHFSSTLIIIYDLNTYTKAKSGDISTSMFTVGLSLLASGKVLSSSNTEFV